MYRICLAGLNSEIALSFPSSSPASSVQLYLPEPFFVLARQQPSGLRRESLHVHLGTCVPVMSGRCSWGGGGWGVNSVKLGSSCTSTNSGYFLYFCCTGAPAQAMVIKNYVRLKRNWAAECHHVKLS